MPYGDTGSTLSLMSHANGFNNFRYDSLDAITLVDIDGYFNNTDDNLNIGVGDVILVVDWATAVRTGTISGWTYLIVMAVDAATGAVDTAEGTAGNITNTD
jgi:hypothetical protein